MEILSLIETAIEVGNIALAKKLTRAVEIVEKTEDKEEVEDGFGFIYYFTYTIRTKDGMVKVKVEAKDYYYYGILRNEKNIWEVKE